MTPSAKHNLTVHGSKRPQQGKIDSASASNLHLVGMLSVCLLFLTSFGELHVLRRAQVSPIMLLCHAHIFTVCSGLSAADTKQTVEHPIQLLLQKSANAMNGKVYQFCPVAVSCFILVHV